jgi:hypothetical protein
MGNSRPNSQRVHSQFPPPPKSVRIWNVAPAQGFTDEQDTKGAETSGASRGWFNKSRFMSVLGWLAILAAILAICAWSAARYLGQFQ